MRLGAAGSEFVASLAQRSAEARASLGALEADPGSAALSDELGRRLSALARSAGACRLSELERSLEEGLRLLETADGEPITPFAIAGLRELLFDLPAVAWGETRGRRSRREERGEPLTTHTALVIGPEVVADALSTRSERARTSFECHRTEDAQAAIELAHSVAPDLIVLDADLDDVAELIEALMDDPLTEPVPMIVLGSFADPSEAGRYVAMGVSRTLSKPLGRAELRHVCEGAVLTSENRTQRVTLGEPSVAELGERLAEELRRALVDSVDERGRATRVALGEGTEVLGAVWGAIARVREIVTARTGGEVRFSLAAPEGAIAFAPPLQLDAPRYDRGPRARGANTEVRLTGRRVLVADDDPGVTWFVADLLRAAGCVVTEAVDGEQALALAHRTSPDLVISDVLMPGLDGFALCRALRRDVALRDTPFLLLSWKEDLLQRVRELGAGAAGYLRKESDARAIVGRVREVLRPRARIEARLTGEGEVRGRLDDLSVRSLLEIVCATRPSARVSVRDASFLYEVEIRDGAPVAAIRTSFDGAVVRGPRALAGLVGVGVGRFVLEDSEGAVDGDLAGSLHAQLARPIALARAATHLCTGVRAMAVEELVFDDDALADAMRVATPEARRVVDQLTCGATAKDLVIGGLVDAAWLDELMVDLCARGAVRAIYGTSRSELLEPAIAARLAEVAPKAPEPPTPSDAPYEASLTACGDSESFDLAVDRERERAGLPLMPDQSPSSLLGAVIQELDTRAARPTTPSPDAPLVELAPLKPRSSPRLLEAADEEVEIPRADAESTVLETIYGADEASLSIPLPEPEGTPEPQIAEIAPEGAPKKKTRTPWQMLALLFGIGSVIALLAFRSERAPAPERSAAAAQPVAVTAPLPVYREQASAPGVGGLEIRGVGAGALFVDDAPRAGESGPLTLPVGPHEVRLGDARVSVDVRESTVATVTF
ncbi:MAG TPA: response regulator [Polyangiaceae bacterium]|nr:response regulator [Polyangiaceae bacterium]